ncbi:hypothetical protein MML48_1g10920 [Holotrichia oblita]|uniref:Uncharacterized protein n=1 Tax=Holotrichia oblita TaxID=644536 RepID=A0ACB9TV01_HOLOL|nr:hypothetical protein MML48_1g10920 [Holotrichia oblita]
MAARTCRNFNETYPQLPPMTENKLRRYLANFLTTGSVKIKKATSAPVTGNEDNEVSVLAYFEAFPRASTRAAEHDLGIPRSSIHRIMRNHKLHNFKFGTPASTKNGAEKALAQTVFDIIVSGCRDPAHDSEQTTTLDVDSQSDLPGPQLVDIEKDDKGIKISKPFTELSEPSIRQHCKNTQQYNEYIDEKLTMHEDNIANEKQLIGQATDILNKSGSKWLSIGLSPAMGFLPVVKIRSATHCIYFTEQEWEEFNKAEGYSPNHQMEAASYRDISVIRLKSRGQQLTFARETYDNIYNLRELVDQILSIFSECSQAIHVSKWEHMDALSFLENVQTSRKHITNCSIEIIETEDLGESPTCSPSQPDIVEEVVQDTPTEDSVRRNTATNKKRKISNENIVEILNKRAEERTKLLKTIGEASVKPRNHPIKTFFESMAETVMTFPTFLAVQAKQEVLRVISELELQACETTLNNRNFSSTSTYTTPTVSRTPVDDSATNSTYAELSSVEPRTYEDCADLLSNVNI